MLKSVQNIRMSDTEKTFTVRPWDGGRSFGGLVSAIQRSFPDEGMDADRLATQVLWDQNWEPGGTFALVEEGGGPEDVRGFCLAFHRRMPLPHTPLDADRGYITLFGVDEDLRRRGHGTRLLNAAEDYLRGKGAARALVSPYAPGYFWPGVDVNRHADALAFLAANGYREIMRPLAMQTRLEDVERPDWLRRKVEALRADPAASVDVRPYHPDLAPFIHDFMVAEFPGDWERWVRDAALDIHAGRAQPERLLFAWDNATNSVVGMVHWNNERFGPVGTAPRVRGRGIGAWLTFEALEAMRNAGKDVAWFLWTDDKTAQLYREAGFRETRRFALMAKDL